MISRCTISHIDTPKPINKKRKYNHSISQNSIDNSKACIMTEEGVPCDFPFLHGGIEYTDSCVFQERYFWFPSSNWCFTNVTSKKHSKCDMTMECPATNMGAQHGIYMI